MIDRDTGPTSIPDQGDLGRMHRLRYWLIRRLAAGDTVVLNATVLLRPGAGIALLDPISGPNRAYISHNHFDVRPWWEAPLLGGQLVVCNNPGLAG